MTCAIESCESTGRTRRGWCEKHYSRWLRHGNPTAGARFRSPLPDACDVDGCTQAPLARGLCSLHYERQRRYGRTDLLPKRQPRPCVIDGCDGITGVPGTAREWCSAHYHRWLRTGDPLVSLSDLRPPPPEYCTVDGCQKAPWARGLCPMHLMRWRQTGDTGPAAPQWQTPEGMCNADGCQRPAAVGIHQLCKRHHCQMWRAQNQDRARAYDLARYARDKMAPGTSTPEQIRGRIDYYGGRCWICGDPADSIDHVKPLAAGGSNWPANLRPACRPCNSRKSSNWKGSKCQY